MYLIREDFDYVIIHKVDCKFFLISLLHSNLKTWMTSQERINLLIRITLGGFTGYLPRTWFGMYVTFQDAYYDALLFGKQMPPRQCPWCKP